MNGEQAAHRFQHVAFLGSGACGSVYKARDPRNPDRYVALKRITLETDEQGVPVTVLREVAHLRQLDRFEHPNLVKLYEVITGPPSLNQMRLYLVFELLNFDLANVLHTCEMTLPVIQDLTHQLLTAVTFLHNNLITHRDIKPQNVLLTEAGQLKLGDFGLTRLLQNRMPLTPVVVTLWYRAPEVLLNAEYGTAVDLWSCGCILAEMASQGRVLFAGTSEFDQLLKIFQNLLEFMPQKRPSASDSLTHQFFTGYTAPVDRNSFWRQVRLRSGRPASSTTWSGQSRRSVDGAGPNVPSVVSGRQSVDRQLSDNEPVVPESQPALSSVDDNKTSAGCTDMAYVKRARLSPLAGNHDAHGSVLDVGLMAAPVANSTLRDDGEHGTSKSPSDEGFAGSGSSADSSSLGLDVSGNSRSIPGSAEKAAAHADGHDDVDGSGGGGSGHTGDVGDNVGGDGDNDDDGKTDRS